MDFFNLYNDKNQAAAGAASDSDDTSSQSSEDSADVRAAQAQAKLRDYGDEVETSSALPSALDVFDQVDKPPAFLDPEATRALASAAHHGGIGIEATAGTTETTWHGPKNRVPPGQQFDIARLAPQLKGAPRQGTDKRGVPLAAVIEGKAKKARTDEGGGSGAQPYSAAQIAMLGGSVPEKGGSTAAMPVADFLGKGVGGAQLPRREQERKDKEKKKRSLGQSSIGSWKTEAEMVLRQQYD